MAWRRLTIICNWSPDCAWAIDFASVPDANFGDNPVFAPVLDNVTTNCPSGYDKEYDGRNDVSMTKRVLFPGWTPVRIERSELRAANATRGKSATAIVLNPAIFKRLLRDIFISIYSIKICAAFQARSGR